MEQFNHFYLWGLDTKYRMGLYTVAVVFYKGIVNALMGNFTVDSLIILEITLVSFVFACIETAIFPAGKSWGAEHSARRTALWAILANVIYIGASLVFGWFSGVPLWGGGGAGRHAGTGPVCHVVRPAAGVQAGHQDFE